MRKSSRKVCWVLLFTFIVSTLEAGETTLSMELWNRFTQTRTKPKITADYQDVTRNAFSLERGYFGLESKFSDNIKGKFTIDLFSTDKGDKYGDGAGAKLKYAYLEFSKLIPIKDSKLTLGLDKTYFGTIYDWSYPVIEKALEDKEGVISSADYGITFSGYIPNGFGEYQLQMINGEGYSKAGKYVNVNPAGVANIRLIPLPGVSIGGSLIYEQSDTLTPTNKDWNKRVCSAGVGRLAYGPIDIWLEYLTKQYFRYYTTKEDTLTSYGLMIMPIIKLKSLIPADIDLLVRYDKWDPSMHTQNDGWSTRIAGLNWNIRQDMLLQFNWEQKNYQDTTKCPVNDFMVQLRWKFTNLLGG
ncbi:MAG: hypothetical protein PHX21_04235 [bacterium]|nr:hypothetical protein [bacterium]